MTIKDSKYVKIDRLNPFYIIIGTVNEYLDKINRNKYMTLVPINERKEIMKKYEELWSKTRDLIRSITKK